MASNGGEPSSAPQPERWYDLKLGSSFKDHSSTKFYSLRYEFKPASIDKTQDGSLQKNKENRVTVEFHNNQPGKPKVTFEGSSEDYKENDGVLFFDGETFRLERLHRAVKRLRHVRLPGESTGGGNMMSSNSAGIGMESRSPPLGKVTKPQSMSKTTMHPVPVEVERIDVGEPKSPGLKPPSRGVDNTSAQPNRFSPSPEPKSFDAKSYEPEENLEIVVDDDGGTPPRFDIGGQTAAVGFDINIPNQNDTDDEIADVDVSDDEVDKGPNAAEALRAQVHAEEGQQQRTSSSSDSGSESGSSGTGSGSGSSSSDSEGSEDDTASSVGDDIDIC